jgi:hypothetical protein
MGYKVGMLFLHYKRPLEARSLFAQAFGAASQRGGQNYISQNNILRGWGEAEHQLGNCQEGCRLCHLGRTVLHGLKEQVSNPLAMKEIDETEALIARLGCDEA